VPALPPAPWELVLWRLAAPDVRSAACACAALRCAAASAPLWRALYLRRWGATAAAAAAAAAAATSPDAPLPPCWRAAYAARAAHLGALRCRSPGCRHRAAPRTGLGRRASRLRALLPAVRAARERERGRGGAARGCCCSSDV
jgi:hypothetical protein